jgi:hypothetical protein
MKKFIFILLLLTFSALSIFFWQVWQTNQQIEPVSHAKIQQHFLKSISWLDSNYTGIENIQNPILWWMIKQAAQTSGNRSLQDIFNKYKKNHLDTSPANLSTPMFNELYRPRLPDISQLSVLHDYQIFFFYALSCDDELGTEPLIQDQLSSDYCSMHYLHPRCITHQLMGLRFMQRYQCGYDEKVASTIDKLQQLVVSELTWDFRVGDAYIQRVLMLTDSGAYNHIKPVWIKNILQAQNDDGSWDDLHPILSLGNGKVLAHTSTLPKIKAPKADFHATAQAIWLLSLLLDKNTTD